MRLVKPGIELWYCRSCGTVKFLSQEKAEEGGDGEKFITENCGECGKHRTYFRVPGTEDVVITE